MRTHPRRVQGMIDSGHSPNCVCCFTKENLTFDHIIPLSKGGKDCTFTNGQILCEDCNKQKGNDIITIKELRERQINIYCR